MIFPVKTLLMINDMLLCKTLQIKIRVEKGRIINKIFRKDARAVFAVPKYRILVTSCFRYLNEFLFPYNSM